MITTSTINCSYSDPRWILKTGEIRTLEPLSTAGSNANFQFSSSVCEYEVYNPLVSSSTIAVYGGFTSGEIVNSVLLFMVFLAIILGVMVAKFMGQKIQPRV